MRTNVLIWSVAALLGTGCAHWQKTAAPTAAAAEIPAAPPAPVSATDLDPANAEKVRVGESLKAYPVGRYLDPQDPDLMHEAHVVYRREAGASWNLNPNAPTVVPLGPVLAVADPAKIPSPLPAELEQKMAEQNQLVATLIEQNEALAKELAKLGQELSVIRARQTGEAK
jgi:hypothetical protein